VQGRSTEGRLLALYGLGVLPLDESLRRHLGVDTGVVVSEVWTGYPGERAGLRPGDVILSADQQPVAAPQELQPLLASAVPVETVLGVWRRRQRREIRLERAFDATPSPASELPAGRSFQPADGYAVEEVVDGSPAAEAGIRAGDRLLRVDFATPRTAAEAQRALSGRHDPPVFVEVRSGKRRFGALLQ